MPGLGSSYGRGGATTTQQDLQNSDVIMIMGSNFAECHPVGFRWVMKAKAKGAKLIHVDPGFTRTSAMADTYAPIRAGSDIIFLGGLINLEVTQLSLILGMNHAYSTFNGVTPIYVRRNYDGRG